MTLAVHRRMDQTVTVSVHSGMNTYGDPQYSTGTASHKARVEGTQRLVKGPDGRDVMARTVVYVGYTTAGVAPTITVQSKLTLPDATTPPIIAVDTLRMRSGGTDHQVVYLG